MITLLKKLDTIEKAVDTLPDFNWEKYVKDTVVRDISEYQQLLDIINQNIVEITNYIPDSLKMNNNDEIFQELDRLRTLFNTYSTLTNDPSEQEKSMQSMKEIVRKLKKSFRI